MIYFLNSKRDTIKQSNPFVCVCVGEMPCVGVGGWVRVCACVCVCLFVFVCVWGEVGVLINVEGALEIAHIGEHGNCTCTY